MASSWLAPPADDIYKAVLDSLIMSEQEHPAERSTADGDEHRSNRGRTNGGKIVWRKPRHWQACFMASVTTLFAGLYNMRPLVPYCEIHHELRLMHQAE
jgi:hypothetical protein